MRNIGLTAIALALALCGQGAEYGFDLRPRGRARTSGAAAAAVAPASDGALRRTALAAGATSAPALSVGDRIAFRLFEDVVVSLTLRERTESPLGGETFLASADGSAALTAVVVQDASGVTATVTDVAAGRVYTVVSAADGVTVREVDPNAGVTEPCRTVVPDMSKATSSAVSPALAASDQPSTLIDVLVAYDRNAVSWAKQNGGGITNFATTAVQKMNTALANTGFASTFRFRLVGVMTVDAAGGADFSGVLEAAQGGTGGWAPIKAMRNAVGADTVTVLIDTGSAYGTTGLGYSLRTTSVASFAENAYNVCSIRAVAQSDTMTHETGHNLGAGHSAEQATQPGPQLYSYSAGYYFTANSKSYHTIMAYGDRDNDGDNDATAIPYFSSPNHTYGGVAVGDATHDNVRTIASTYAAAAKWRAQVLPMSYDVYFSPEDGSTFTDSVTVTLTPGKAGLPIRYTLDGSQPTVSSTLYTGAIRLTKTTTVRAVTVTDGTAGPVFEATYSKSDLGAGADAPQLVWRTGEDYPWTFQTTNTYDGVDALQSAWMPTGSSRDSWLETDVTGPTTMSFAFKSGYSYFSPFTVTCDGTALFTFDEDTYPTDWRIVEVEIPSGRHAVRFNYALRGYYRNCFNGAYIDQVRFDALSRPPTLSPATTDDESTAATFTGSTTVTLKPPAGRTGTLYYTTDGSDPTGETGLVYAGPFTLTGTALVRAVFVEGGKDPSVEVKGLYLERHPVRPGEWTTDVEGVKAAAAKDGRLICVMCGRYDGCSITRRFYDDVACTGEFLSWAEANGVYLVRADSSIDLDSSAAISWFSALMRNYGDSGSYYYTRMYFALPGSPLVAVSKGDASGDYGKIGTVSYSDTVASAIAGFASVLGETVPSAPTTTASALVPSYPFGVTLSNPNGSGTIYYTLDGSVPTRTNGKPYTGPVSIAQATTLKAAVWFASGCSSAVTVLSFTTVGETFGTVRTEWTAGGDSSWRVAADSPRTLRTPHVSGATYASWLQATVSGKGRLVQTLKYVLNSSQNTIAFTQDGTKVYSYGYSKAVGTTCTLVLTNAVTATGTTVFRWTYTVGDSSYDYASCGAWLSDVKWIPENAVMSGGETSYTPSGWTSPIKVDNDWLIGKGIVREGDDIATAATKMGAKGANGLPRYQSYVLGMDPDESAEDQLRVTIGMGSDGKPVIGCEPTPRDSSHVTVRTLGRKTLPSAGDTGWGAASDGDKFFKVEVEVK